MTGTHNPDIDEDLFACLTESDEPPKNADIPLFPSSIQVTERCMKLAYLIGPETKKQGRGDFEVGGFFVFDPEQPFYFNDFIIPPRLPAMYSAIVIAEQFDETTRQLLARNERERSNFKIGAMFHIHPSAHGLLGHSTADNESLDKLLNKLARVTRSVRSEAPYRLIQGLRVTEESSEGLCIRGDAETDAILRYCFPNDSALQEFLETHGIQVPEQFNRERFLAELVERLGPQTFEPRVINYALSFVFDNDRTMPYVKMAVEVTLPLSQKREVSYADKIPIEVVERGVRLPTTAEVEALVKEHVVFYRPKPVQVVPSVVGVVKNGVRRFTRGQQPSQHAGGYPSTMDRYLGDDLSAYGGFWGGNDAQSWQPAQPRTESFPTVSQGASTTPHSTLVKKETSYGIEDLTAHFVLSLYQYGYHQKDPECRYSTYVVDLITAIMDPQLNPSSPSQPRRLREQIMQLGELYPDGESAVLFDHSSGIIDYLAHRLSVELTALPQNQSQEMSKFMQDFVQARSLGDQNRILEMYVTNVLRTTPQKQGR